MHDFQYRQGELYCENVPIARIAKEVGTPCYVYSHHTLVRHLRAYDSAFQSIPHILAFAMKANSNLAILKLMAKEGSGVDIVSGGELYRALRAGVPPSKIVFAGVGKNAEEIREALKADILMFNVESSEELQAINEVAASMGTKARVALRINPDIDPKTHPYISTGLKKSKFGIGADLVADLREGVVILLHHLRRGAVGGAAVVGDGGGDIEIGIPQGFAQNVVVEAVGAPVAVAVVKVEADGVMLDAELHRLREPRGVVARHA